MPVSDVDAEFVRNLVRTRSAIQIDESKAYLIEMRLAALVKDQGLQSVSELVACARRGDAEVRTKIVEAMSTYETSFFRDLQPFNVLRRELLPRLIAARATSRSLNIWCAACSSGQEPYSIAMLMLEDFPSLSSWKSRIIATDHSEQILDRARSGTFSQLEVNRGLPAQMLVKYFTKVGVQWELRADVRKLVEFRNVNLIEPFPFGTSFDVVFLRNVLIYFDVPTKRAILEQVRKVMAPDGSLFLGAAETTINVDDGWERTGASGFPYYQTRK